MFLKFLVFLSGCMICNGSNINHRVIELNNRFLDIYKDGYWLVMFYAPWCAHCKRLDPIWSHVQQDLHDTGIRVCQVDCVTFTKTCDHFNVRNYPTVMFIKSNEMKFIFNGERTKNEIIHFALRVASPPVKLLKDDNDTRIKDDGIVYFAYIGDTSGELWEAYENLAVTFHQYSYFFYAPPEIAEKYFSEIKPPSIFVSKEKSLYHFNPEEWGEDLNSSLASWVNAERFLTFMKVTWLNIDLLLQSKKFLVLAVVEENKVNEVPAHMLEFRNMVESVIRNHRDRFHRKFLFGWIGTPDLANSIAMKKLPLPYLLVLNSSTHHHHIPDDDPHQLTPEAITIFLDTIQNQSAVAYGGNSLPYRLYRMYYDFTTLLVSMCHGNPVLSTVLFGLPLGFLSLICYSICCPDIMVANDDDVDSEETFHEKKE